jgi:uroporphyrinogen decarboxylase
MTRRERILTNLRHERPDRPPSVYGARAEVTRGLMRYYGVEDMGELMTILGTDGWGRVGYEIRHPGDYESRVNGSFEGDMPYSGADYIMHDDVTFEDVWGVVRRIGSDRKYVEWVTGPLADAVDPDEYDFPGPECIVPQPDLPEKVQAVKDQDLYCSVGCDMPYKKAWELRGLENTLADYIVNPAFLEKLYDKIHALFDTWLVMATEAGVDEIGFGGDVAMQDRIIMGPDAWRRIDKPRLKAVFDKCRAINPDVHIKIHSDGNLWDIMEDLIEVGFDVIDPIQPECMEPVEVKRRFGDRIVLHGCGSIQRTLPFGTVDDVRKETSDLIEQCGYDGGLVVRASNVIGYDCPTENVVAFYETIRDWKW